MISAGRSFYEFFRVKPEETLGQLVYELGNNQWDIPKLRKLLEEIVPQHTSFNNFEIEAEFDSIGRCFFLLNARQIERALSEEKLIFLSIEEISDRKQLETLLAESEERFRRLFETANDGILLLEKKELRISFANPAITDMLGYSNKELIGKCFAEIGFADNIGSRQEVMETLNKSGIIHYKDAPLHKKTGELLDTDVYMVDKARLIQCNIRDVTERKKLAEDLSTARKLEAVGHLAGGIAHDFNNILTAITGNISMARMQTNPEDKIFDLLSEAESASIRAQTLTRQLLTFAKGGMPIKEVISIEDLLKLSPSFMLHGSKSDCEYSIAEDLWLVDADIGQISQVINNLIINADQAMTEGGTIQVAAENLIIDNSYNLPVKAGKYIRITIKDQGIGIAKDYLSKIFDPYYSTKKEGSGLGLATTYTIIRKHDGLITVESQPGVGTTFHVYLPATSKIAAQKDGYEVIKGHGRILVMDDEVSLQILIGRMLKVLGYEAEFANDGTETIEMFKEAIRAEKPYDALIIDLTIPGKMGGMETMKRLSEIDPDLKAIVFSGYSDSQILANYAEYGFKGMMAKPFEIRTLGMVLHDVLKGEVT